MTATQALHRSARSPRRAPPAHVFEVGQTVRLKGGAARLANSGGLYRVTRTLPPVGDAPQYRIRSEDDAHERVTTQDSLEPVRAPGAGLAARVFGNAPGKA